MHSPHISIKHLNTKNIWKTIGVIMLFMVFSCKQKNDPTGKTSGQAAVQTSQTDYLALVISLDTLSPPQYNKTIHGLVQQFEKSGNAVHNPFYHYFRAKKMILEKKRDSALIEYRHMRGPGGTNDTDLLSDYSVLNNNSGNGVVIEAVMMKRMLGKMETAEQSNSKITYLFYDLLAKAYYQNHNEKDALIYIERYHKSHPYRMHRVIQQRYFDICFLLASRMNDFKKMMDFNTKARVLAKSINDSLALARTYDNEAQIYVQQGENDKAIAASKVYFNYLKRKKNLNGTAFNNLATSFEMGGQPDSAIHYYLEGIAFEGKNSSAKSKSMFYNGLKNAYKMKKDFARALQAADSAYTIEIKDITEIEAVKVAEMHEKYETEKKDRSITELNGRNTLYQKIIVQQRWTLGLALLIFLGGLSFFYIIYRQQRLKGKNKLLESENKRLCIEQRLFQAQLNPHFVFNSIANLQGLIASGDTKQSVRYLTAFSQLLRSVLEQNRKEFIDLNEEIASLNNYLQLQQMRYVGLFDYEIITDQALDLDDTMIPPMLIQPFIENSIEHGFRNIDYKGRLIVSFTTETNQLVITIDDNGIGINRKEKTEKLKTSLAQVILKDRLDVLFRSIGHEAGYKVEEKNSKGVTGVMVEIRVPLIND